MKPFQQSYPWTPVNRGAAARNGFHTRLQPGDDFFGYGLPPGSSSHLMQAGEDFRQGLGFEIDDVWVTGQVAGSGFDFFFGDGADITQRLRHDHVRLQGFEDGQIEGVERLHRLEPLAYEVVYFLAGRIGWDERVGDFGQGADGRRVVALVCHTDELGFKSKRTDDFRGTWQQGNNTEVCHRDGSPKGFGAAATESTPPPRRLPSRGGWPTTPTVGNPFLRRFSLFLNFAHNVIQRFMGKHNIPLLGVVAIARRKLLQKAHCIHYAQLSVE